MKEDDEDISYNSCPKCGRSYDEIGHDLQYCKVCGWDAENNEWIDSVEPDNSDFMNGDADIFSGRWY